MRLESLTIERLLSFDDSVTVGPMGPVAAIIGRNNVGKSNLFRAVSLFLQWTSGANVQHADAMSKVWHSGTPTSGSISLNLDLDKNEWPGSLRAGYPAYRSPYLVKVLVRPTPDASAQVVLDVGNDAGRAKNFIAAVAPRLIILSAQRKTSHDSPGSGAWGVGVPWDGQGFKAWLNTLDRGRTSSQQLRAAAFREDLHGVAGMENLNPTVHPLENNSLDVLLEDAGHFRASLEDCGTGLQTVLFVLSALHRGDGAVVLVDDPEAHLHPAAQATFARVVVDRANVSGGQVVFVTNSPAILDAVPPDQVFEVKRIDGVSRVSQMGTTDAVFASLRELGYRPSLLQMADAVLFVEGPHDVSTVRIWWRKLFNEDPEPLVALLPLGGSAMRYLQLSTVNALGRRCFALLDSDRSTDADPPKQEILDFADRLSGAVATHILERRELENYFTPEAVQEGCALATLPEFGPFTDLEHEIANFSKAKDGAIARAMAPSDIPIEVVEFLRVVRNSSLS
jgi:hypothetical protein